MCINSKAAFLRANDELGGMVSVSTAALVAGVSRNRIYELVSSGWLEVHSVWGQQCIGVDELARWCQKRDAKRRKMALAGCQVPVVAEMA
jgi:hypothetical protein